MTIQHDLKSSGDQAQWRIRVGLVVVTLAYLLAEIAFNADLVRFLGGRPTIDEIHEIENYGRTLTGIAAALVIVGIGVPFSVRKGIHPFLVILIWSAVSVGTIWSVNRAIDVLVTSLTESTGAKQRQLASLANYLTTNIHSDDLVVANFRLTPEFRNSTEGHLFMGSLPFLLYMIPDLERHAKDGVRELLVRDFERKVGVESETFFKFFKTPSERIATDAYASYVKIVTAFNDAINSREANVEREWQAFVARLRDDRRCRCTPEQAAKNPRLRTAVVNEARRTNPELPANWSPDDQATFLDIGRQRYDDGVRTRYNNAVRQLFQTEIDIVPGSINTLQSFIALPAFGDLWKRELKRGALRDYSKEGLKDSDVDNLIKLGFHYYDHTKDARRHKSLMDAYRREFYEPMFKRQVDVIHDDFTRQTASFAPGGEWHKRGYDLMKTVIIIPIALFFSALGALTHIVKLLFLTYSLRFRHGIVSMMLFVAVLPVVVVHSYGAAALPSLDEKPVYHLIEKSVASATPQIDHIIPGFLAPNWANHTPVSQAVGRTLIRAVINGEQDLCKLGELIHRVVPTKRFARNGPT